MERRTRQRAALKEAIERAARPLTPQEILEAGQAVVPGLGIATVYRNVKALLAEGWLQKVEMPGSADRYERAGPAAPPPLPLPGVRPRLRRGRLPRQRGFSRSGRLCGRIPRDRAVRAVLRLQLSAPMSPALLVTLYAVCIAVIAFVGGSLNRWLRLTHTRMQLVVSLVAGLMLGVSLFHMLPHAAGLIRDIDRVMWWFVIGLLGMFFLLRAFHFHDHSLVETPDGEPHAPDCDHHHHGEQRLSWVGLIIGLGLHTVLDGVALSAAVVAESTHSKTAGLGTFLAVALHKPLDALAITAMLRRAGESPRRILLANLAFALLVPLGAAAFMLGVDARPGPGVGCALALAGGVFLCLALSDLLPEVQFHSHDRLKLSAALLLGIALAYGIVFLEGDAHGIPADHPFLRLGD